jgi:hypothetical protein
MPYTFPEPKRRSLQRMDRKKILETRGVFLAPRNNHESHHVFTTDHHVLTTRIPSKTGSFSQNSPKNSHRRHGIFFSGKYYSK